MLLQMSDEGVFALLAGLGIGLLLLLIFIALAVSTLFLMIGLKVVDAKNREFWTVFVTTLVNLILLIIPILGIILDIFVIKSRHDTSFLKALVAWLIAVLLPFVIMYFIYGVLGIIPSGYGY